MAPGHKTCDCRSSNHCSGFHHTCRLHKYRTQLSLVAESMVTHTETEPQQQATTPVHSVVPTWPDEHTLLTIAQVILKALNCKHVQARAFLDPGTAVSMISKTLAQQLKLHHHTCTVTGREKSGDLDDWSVRLTDWLLLPSEESIALTKERLC